MGIYFNFARGQNKKGFIHYAKAYSVKKEKG
jgi:hypothetical protein